MLKAVLFDLDGVLIDSEGINAEAAEQAFSQQGIQITDEDKIEIIGKHPEDFLVYFTSQYRFSAEQFNEAYPRFYHDDFSHVKQFKTTIALAKELKREGLRIGLVTSSERETAAMALDMIGLSESFEVVVTREDCSKRKPDPLPYLLAAQKLGVAPHECAVLEDSVTGLTAAKAAGMKCIIVTSKEKNTFSQADLVKKHDELTILDILNLIQ